MAGDGVMEFYDWIIMDALKRNACVKMPEFPDELTCVVFGGTENALEWRVYVPKGRECSECKERKGYYLDAETIRNQQEHIAELTVERDAYFEMVKRVQADCDARDELIRDMLSDFKEQMHGPTIYPQTWYVAHKIRAQKLGIEVEYEG